MSSFLDALRQQYEKRKELRICIIGAGIHGMTTGIELAKSGYNVTILDKNKEIFGGTSGATHNRAHLGYHYPRSIETAKECIKGLENFRSKYPEAIVEDFQSYYMIEKSGNISLKEYEFFCNELGIPFRLEWPSENFLNRDLIEGGIVTAEPVFDVSKLKKLLLEKIEELDIELILDAEIIEFKELPDKTYSLLNNKNGSVPLSTDVIINATYAYYNNVLKILDLEEDFKKYKIQYTEIIVVESPEDLSSITIMDGPFVSIMKYAGTDNQYLLYDVKNSTLYQEENYFVEYKDLESNFDKIIEHFRKYFPFVDDLKYVESWRGYRPIPLEITDDARNTTIKQHEKYPGIFSILEGKFISSTLIAEEICNLVKRNHD